MPPSYFNLICHRSSPIATILFYTCCFSYTILHAIDNLYDL